MGDVKENASHVQSKYVIYDENNMFIPHIVAGQQLESIWIIFPLNLNLLSFVSLRCRRTKSQQPKTNQSTHDLSIEICYN